MTTIDQVLEAANRYAGAGRGILFVARTAIAYQPGCGPSRPVYSHSFLVLHPKDANNSGTWVLPESVSEVVPPDVFLDEATANVAGIPVALCVEFAPVLGEKYDDASWHHSDFVVGHPWVHPDAQRAVESFERGHNYFDQPSKGSDDMSTRKNFIEAQSKADRVARAFGDAAEPWLNGESEQEYRVRLLSKYKSLSKAYKDADLSKIHDPVTFDLVESAIYQDAMTSVTANVGPLREVRTPDASGRWISRSYGADGSCWDNHNPPYRLIKKFNTAGAR